ncbi:heme-degrading domain-containing protein [Vibrio nitrifigilis]|uniref:Heme-degrading domain-containing protein n=1 Tax=Vibrio nitrifigilis TaxID=2789781 RepID=A0ABS0GM41_9VIBR|nr:heme-degrading domain-containing protein [Vibrio nitrifigilis]MBF9003513.1 heme-degrading domain-containing protein [Vibrio nitrifigilis]
MNSIPIPDMDTLVKQEQEARFSSFSFADAWSLGNILYQKALERKAPVALEIYAFNQVLFQVSLPESAPDNLEWMRRKRNTVLRMTHSSLLVGQSNDKMGARMEQQNFINQAEYCDHGGSFPLRLTSGAVIGAVSASGLPSHEDHALVFDSINTFLHQ